MEELRTPPIPETPELVAANRRLQEAVANEAKAHEAWSALEIVCRDLNVAFVEKWGSIDAAPQFARDTHAKELARPMEKAAKARQTLDEQGRVAVECRAQQAAAQHAATQQAVASW